jgi:hypothetical protein
VQASLSISPVDVAQELELIIELLARRLDRAPADLRPYHRLVADLKVGGLTLAIIGLELQDITGAWLPYPRLVQAETIADLARIVALTHGR